MNLPFNNDKVDWQLIANTVHWYKDNGKPMERAFASLLFEVGISEASGGQFRYVGNEEIGVDLRINGSNEGLEIKSQFDLFPKTKRGVKTKKMGYTSFHSAEKTCDDFEIHCDHLILIDKNLDRFRCAYISKETMEKHRFEIFTENKSGINAQFPMKHLTFITDKLVSHPTHNFSPIEVIKNIVRSEVLKLYNERNEIIS